MRILQISSARSIGGGERHVIDLSNELARRGHEVYSALAFRSPLLGELNQIHEENVSIHHFRNAIDLTTATGIAKFARENKFDVINVHLAKDYPIAAAVSLAERIPYVITRHVLFPMSRLHRFVLRDARFVIAPSNAVAENLRRELIFAPEKIATIRYGLDIAKFPERKRIEQAVFTVGAVGNIDRVKGFDVLVRAAAIVVKEIPAARFEIVGEDRSKEGRNEKELRDLIAELELSEVVTLKGWSHQIADTLAGWDLFVSSSRSESFGFVMAEAMLAGVPIVASETEGALEIIDKPELGRLVPVGSAEALSEALIDLAHNPPELERLSQFGRAHIQQNFSIQRMVDETEALFQRVISKI